MTRVIKKIGIVGHGYVGAATAEACLDAGYQVVAIDKHSQDSTSYPVSNDHSLLHDCDAVIVCVPTPLTDGTPDYSAVFEAAASINEFVSPQTLIVLESTVGVGFTRESFAREFPGNNVYIAHVPERLNPGSSLSYKEIPRVVGGLTTVDRLIAMEFYQTIVDSVTPAGIIEEAEASKLLENSFRLLNIAFINEFAEACSDNNLDANNIIKLASTKSFGFMPFYPSAGAGGHCIPVDPEYLMESLGPINLLREAMISNDMMTDKIIAKAGDVANKKIAIIGTSYKPGVADTRESAGTRLLQRLLSLDANAYVPKNLVDDDTDLAIITIKDFSGPIVPEHVQTLDVSEGL